MKKFTVGNISFGSSDRLIYITGPCVIESLDHTRLCAEFIKQLEEDLGVSVIFKASFDKANRSSIHSYRGPGIDKGLDILNTIKQEFDLLVTSDIHLPEHAAKAADVLDIIQIPAFLSRQTDLLVAAAQTEKCLHIKKGQFMAPWDMKNVIQKITETNPKTPLFLTDRGYSFGYNALVSDMRAIPEMKKFGYPVCFDATHSTQMPAAHGDFSGGDAKMAETLAKSAVAAGADIIYMESHNDPENALSDAKCVISHSDLKSLMVTLDQIHSIVQHQHTTVGL